MEIVLCIKAVSVLLLLQLILCCSCNKKLLFLSSLCPVCLNEEFTDTCAPMELLFNFRNALYLE